MTVEHVRRQEIKIPEYKIVRYESGAYAGIKALTLDSQNNIVYHRQDLGLVSSLLTVNLEPVKQALSAPAMIYFDPSLKCDLSCPHCLSNSRNGNNQNIPELSTEQALNICEQIISAGVLRVKIGGGEPLLYPSLWPVIEKLADSYLAVDIATSGFHLPVFDQDKLDWCRQHRVSFSISLDGEANYHDNFRGQPVYANAISGIKRLKDNGIFCKIRSTFCNTPESMAQLPGMVELANSLAIPLKIKLARPAGRARNQNLAFTQPDEAYWSFVQQLRQVAKAHSLITISEEIVNYNVPEEQLILKTGLDCGAGTRAGQINAHGNFSPCAFLTPHYPGHNLLNSGQSLLDFWRFGSDFMAIRDFFRAQNENPDSQCPTCNYRHACQGGCPSVRLFSQTIQDPRCPAKNI